MTPFVKVGLALGGGGAKGIAHLGVLKVLEEEDIPFHLIAGTSFGSIVGAMYAQTPNVDSVRERVIKFLGGSRFRRTKIFFIKKHYEQNKTTDFLSSIRSYLQKGIFWGISLQRTSFIPEEDFLEHLSYLLDDKEMDETVVPFAALAADLIGGDEVVLTKGPLRKSVAASCAIPGVFPPIKIGDALLIDGGWVNQVPVEPLRKLGANFTIAVDISEEKDASDGLNSGLDIVLRSGEITRRTLSHLQLSSADLVISPKMDDIHWSDFWRYKEAMKRGEEAARLKVDELKQLILKRQVKNFFKLNI
ncbi:MAG: patatin-like phospholipase family protein [Nitrospiria bacterium]